MPSEEARGFHDAAGGLGIPDFGRVGRAEVGECCGWHGEGLPAVQLGAC